MVTSSPPINTKNKSKRLIRNITLLLIVRRSLDQKIAPFDGRRSRSKARAGD